jgi:hypothetical protein
MSSSGRARLRALGMLVLAVAVVAAPGCGAKSRRLPVYPARGQVLVGGKPAANAVVTLWPESSGTDVDPYSPTGKADEEGRFTLSTYASGDGAPAGSYTVTVEWPERFNVLSNQWEGDKLKGRYNDKTTSTLRAKVEKQSNELPPIQIVR